MRTILFPPSSPHLDLFPGIINKDMSVILNLFVSFSIIFCSVVSLVSKISQFHPSTLHVHYRSRSQVGVSNAVMLALANSFLANLILLTDSLLHSFWIFILV